MEQERTPAPDTYWICPLYSFRCTINVLDPIDLGGGVAIWRISSKLENCLDQSTLRAIEYNNAKWVIRLPHNPRGRPTPQDDVITDLEAARLNRVSHEFLLLRDSSETVVDLITALRLQHKGDVAPGMLLQIHVREGEFIRGGVTQKLHLSQSEDYFVLVQTEYELLETELDAFREFWRDFQDKRLKGKISDIRIALRRFNSSYGEHGEDRLIDHTIALESLYLGKEQELGYKLALRAAFFLAPREKERKQIFDRLKKAYTARGKIVHGGEHPANLRELVADTEEYLRQSIRRFLELCHQYTLRQLRDRLLDQNILEAGRLLRAE